MFIVGVTGGIGSGKSAITDLLEKKGITIVDADVIARQVVEPDSQALLQIEKRFGSDILTADGNLDRAALRKIIFADTDAKQWLEQLLHPLIGAETFRQLETADGPYVVFVSPLLVESGQDAICDRVLVIDVPEALQISRTCERDNNDPEQIKAIIASQASRQQRLEKADDRIDNSGDLATLNTTVERLHLQYLKLAAGTDIDEKAH
ncbi:MAG: dephospho-CoA kinase [Pseudomonadales bacterium]